jgi:thiamine pyrophosphokinase
VRAVIFAGGDPTSSHAVGDLRADAFIIAADSGAAHAVRLGWPVDLLVGDLDSVPPELVVELEERGTKVERHPAAKDRTDLALALDAALALEALTVTVVGGHGGRLDHLLANVLLLASDDYAGMIIDARMGAATVSVIRGRRPLRGEPDELVSLLATSGPARGVTTDGLLFPLRDAVLRPGSSRGVSNQFVATAASVEVAEGVLVAVQPGARGVIELGPELDLS